MEILFRYVHFLGMVLTAGTLLSEMLLVRKKLNGFDLRRLAMLDGAYGLSILVLLAGGFLQWFMGSKPSFFYTNNPVFLLKVGLVALIGILSIYPTVWFIKKRKTPESQVVDVPDAVRILIRFEAALLLVIPLLAVLMARGVGLD